MGNPVVHFEVTGKNPKELQKFYHDAFDWEFEDVMGDYAMAHPRSDSGIEGGIGPANGSDHVTFYIGVDNISKALEKVKGLGGSVMSEPMEVPGGPTIAMFRDPEGHEVGLVMMQATQ